MQSKSPEFIRRITDVLDEIIPAIPVDDGTPALISRVRQCILKAAGEEQASYKILLAVASAEICTITNERTERAGASFT
jgi:hypothetical protein